MNFSQAFEGTSGNWQLPWAPNYVTLEFFVSFVILSRVSPATPASRETPAPGRRVHRAALPRDRTLGTRNLYATHKKGAAS